MKNYICKLLCIFLCLNSIIVVYAQSIKPIITILPSDNWCFQRYFTQSYDNQGTIVRVSDYSRAFNEDTELPIVIAKVGSLLSAYGYSIKDAAHDIKNIANRKTEDELILSKTSGASIKENPLDILKRKLKCDIIILFSWNVNIDSGKKIVSFTIEAFDSYTSKRISSVTEISMPSNDPVPVILEKLVAKNIKYFDKQFSKWFADINKNGREIMLTIRCWDNWENDLETEYDGTELLDIIRDWMYKNTVNGNFNLSDATETFARFEQVRIPLVNKNGISIDARSFVNDLRMFLQNNPYYITSKVITSGLGKSTIILGEK